MALRPDGEESAVERRYGRAAAREWDLVLRHFDLATGFALIVLIVPDRDGAALCAAELERFLSGRGQPLRRLEPEHPQDLRRIALPLLEEPRADPKPGAIWVSAVISPAAPDVPEWQDAWRYALATLNQQRNPLRRRFDCPLIIVGAPWVLPVFREIAPDLWSVRTLVVHIAPAPAERRTARPDRGRDETRLVPLGTEATPDLDLALDAIARLRGIPGQESDLALALLRAGRALHDRGDFAGAAENFRQSADLRLRLGDRLRAGVALDDLARAIRDQGRAAEAETLFREALALQEAGGDTAVSRGITLDELARAIRDQGRAAEAETLFREALALQEAGGAAAISRGITLDNLARAIHDQGRAAEAEGLFRQALALAEEGGATAVWRGITLDNLARAILDQGRAAEAETLFRAALALKEEGGDTAVSRGVALHELARAIRDQGRAAEAETLFRQALALYEAGGAPPDWRGITLARLAGAVRDQGRAEEADALEAQARALREPAPPPPVSPP
jgi:tetratricopeptide (TPR) repeat protein